MTKKEMLGQMEELRSTCVDICTNLSVSFFIMKDL